MGGVAFGDPIILSQMLKQFYRELCKKYHPDSNQNKDTSQEMQLINRLKEAWGV